MTPVYNTLFKKLKRRGALGVLKSDPSTPDEAVTLESVMDQLVIHGSPAKGADAIMALKEEIGPFGTLLYAGMDWHDRDLARDSMIKLAEKVVPRIGF